MPFVKGFEDIKSIGNLLKRAVGRCKTVKSPIDCLVSEPDLPNAKSKRSRVVPLQIRELVGAP